MAKDIPTISSEEQKITGGTARIGNGTAANTERGLMARLAGSARALIALTALSVAGCGADGNGGAFVPPAVDAGGGGTDPLCKKAPVGTGGQLGDTFVKVGRDHYERSFPGKSAMYFESAPTAQELFLQSTGGLSGYIITDRQEQGFGPQTSVGFKFEPADRSAAQGVSIESEVKDSFTVNTIGGSATIYQGNFDDLQAKLGQKPTPATLTEYFNNCFINARGLSSASNPASSALSTPSEEQAIDIDANDTSYFPTAE